MCHLKSVFVSIYSMFLIPKRESSRPLAILMPILGERTLIFVIYDRSLTLGLLSATLEKRECNLSEPFPPPGISLKIRKELTFSTGSTINSHELYPTF